MKNSGVEWIGKIPDDWEVKRFKYIVDSLEKGNGISKDEVFENGDTSCVRYGEIYTKYSDSFSKCFSKTKKDIISVRKFFSNGDILFAGTGELIEEIGKNIVYLGNEECLAGGDIIIAKHSQNPKFLNYSLNSSYAQAQKSQNKTKLKVVHISASEIGNITLLLPPKSTQKKIAAYLDSKCSKIEETIQNQQKVIEKLKVYKQSLITEAVTGKIKIQNMTPDFQYCNLGFVAEFKNGLNYNASDFGNEVKFLGVGDFQNYLVLNEKSMFSNIITDTEIEEDYYLKNGDIIFVRSNGSKELVGRAIMVDNIDFKVTYSGFCIRLRNKEPQKINSKFLLYFFRSDYFRSELQRLSQGSNISNINQDLLSHIKIPLVDMKFQESVIDFLNQKCTAIDTAIEQKQKLIEKLTEYKKSLIYECVTGKKEI